VATEWVAQAQNELEHALSALDRATGLSDSETELVRELVGHRGQLLDSVAHFAQAGVGSIRTRIHGDLHLGQVLVAGGDVQIIDFEGEPRKTMTQRRAKASPMRDVAGMIRSFDYVTMQVARTHRLSGAPSEARIDSLLATFRGMAEEAFLASYTEGLGTLMSDGAMELINLFALEKAAYEVGYEAANRPDWLAVPLRGLARIAAVLVGGAPA